MSKIQRTLIKYGRTRNRADEVELQAYVSSLTVHEICGFVSSTITHSEAPQYIGYLLQGFSKESVAGDRRQQVLKHILELMGTRILSTELQNALTSKICTDLKRYYKAHLVDLTNICVDMIHAGDPRTNLIWKKLLPALMSLLVDSQSLQHNNTNLTGLEFKAQIISALCVVRWPNNIVTSLASMFTEMELSKDDHSKVCNKLCAKIYDMDPSSLPPLMHQLLILCETYNNVMPIFVICDYFSKNLHKDLEDSSSERAEIDSIDSDPTELQHAEQTILYHIHSLVTSSQSDVIMNFLGGLRNINKWPTFILRLFPIQLLLMLASVKDLQSLVFEIIQTALFRKFKQLIMSDESAWMRETIRDGKNVENLMSRVIETSVKDNVMITEGLVGLAFNLLDYSNECAEQIHILGVTIIVKLSKRQQKLVPVILNEIIHKIDTQYSELQYSYIHCLRSLVECVPFTLIQSQECKNYIVRALSEVHASSTKHILKSIMPLVKISPPLRDSFIMILEKVIFTSECLLKRQMGVFGLCLLIGQLQISFPNSARISQQTLLLRSSSTFSQTGSTIDQPKLTYNSSPFETICLEVLGKLGGGLMKQAEVKSEIYRGLSEVINKNPPLCCNILEMLSANLEKYISTENNSEMPIIFDVLLTMVDDDVIVMDSLGQLIICISTILVKALEIDTSSCNNRAVMPLQKMLNSLCDRMQKYSLADYGLDGDLDLSGVDIENKKKTEILKQVLMIIESLIIYKVLIRTSQPDNQLQEHILSLFKTYKIFIDYSKSFSKSKKSAKKKDSIKNTSKPETTLGSSVAKFVVPKTLLTLPILNKILGLLYRDSHNDVSDESAKCLKVNIDLHHYALDNLLIILQELSNIKDLTKLYAKKKLFHQLVECGLIIYQNCICKLQSLENFDLQTSRNVVEAMYILLHIVDLHYHKQFLKFLAGLHPEEDNGNLEKLLGLVLVNYKNHLDKYVKDDVDSSIDQNNKIGVNLIQSTYILCKYIIPGDSLSLETLEWIRLLTLESKNDAKTIAKPLMKLLLRFDSRINITSALSENAAMQICSLLSTINEEVTECMNPLSIITDLTIESIVQSICDACRKNLERIDWAVHYIYAYHTILINSISNDNRDSEYICLKERESFICVQLCHIINISNILSNAKVPTGICSDSILRMLLNLYTCLSSLTKYFIKRTSRSSLAFLQARFEKVVKLAGKRLCVTAYRFITHIEEMQDNKDKSKVLRQTKVIPNLIFAIESFRKSVVALSCKSNDTAKTLLISSLNIGTSRDFRLKLPKLQDALNNIDNDESTLCETDENETIISETEMEDDAEENESENIPLKRIRLK